MVRKRKGSIRTVLELTFGELYDASQFKSSEEPVEENEELINPVEKKEDVELDGERAEEIERLQQQHENIVQEVVEAEQYLLESHSKASEKDRNHGETLKDRGLVLGIDEPFPKTVLSLDKSFVEQNSLVNLQNVIAGNEFDEFCLNEQRTREAPHVEKKKTSKSNKAKLDTTSNFAKKEAPRLSHAEVDENKRILKKMARRLNYLKCPRHVEVKYRITTKQPKIESSNFAVSHEQVKFCQYTSSGRYMTFVTITNKSFVSRRFKIMPPKTKYFRVDMAKYPSSSGLIAPGMAAKVAVYFQPDALRSFEDHFLLCTESGQIAISILAERESPNFNFPEIMDFGACLINGKKVTPVQCVNSGGNARCKLAHESAIFSNLAQEFEGLNAEIFSETHASALQVGCFTISPALFMVEKNQSIKFQVNFNPKQLGTFQETFQIMCDNEQIFKYTLIGVSVDVDIPLLEVDGAAIKESCAQDLSLYFDKVCCGSKRTRAITVKNKTPIDLEFFWKIKTDESRDSEWSVDAMSGVLPSQKLSEFKFTFSPLKLSEENLRSSGQIFIKNVPSEAGASHKNFLSLPLVASVAPIEITSTPSQLIFEEPIYAEQETCSSLLLTNTSDGSTSAEVTCTNQCLNVVKMEPDSRPSSARLELSKTTTVQFSPKESVKIDFVLNPKNTDEIHGEICIKVQNGRELFIPYHAVVSEREVQFLDRELDFGILNFGEKNVQRSVKTKIRNNSDCPTEFSLYEMRDESKAMNFIPKEGILQPNETIDILATLKPKSSGKLLGQGVAEIKHGEPAVISLKASVFAPLVEVQPNILDFGKSFCNVKRSAMITLVNKTDLKTMFEWEEFHSSNWSVSFSPVAGKLDGKQSKEIELHIVCHNPGKKVVEIPCQCTGTDPFYLTIKTIVKPLSVSYHKLVTKKTHIRKFNKIQQRISKWLHASDLCDKSDLKTGLSEKETSWLEKYYSQKNAKLPKLKFKNLEIYKQSQMKIVIRNHTAVPTKFNAFFEEFDQDCLDQLKTLVDSLQKTLLTEEVLKENALGKNRNYPNTILTSEGTMTYMEGLEEERGERNEHEHSRPKSRPSSRQISSGIINQTSRGYSSAQGRAYLKEKLQKEMIQKILKGKGAAFVAYPITGSIDPWSSVVLTIYCFNDMCGEFISRLTCQVEGLNPVWLDCDVRVVGSPLSIPQSNVGIHIPKSKIKNSSMPIMNWMPSLVNSGSHQKSLRIENSGSFDIRLEWQLFDLDTKHDILNFSCEMTNDGLISKVFAKTDEECSEFSNADYCFNITPPSIVIPAQGSTKCNLFYKAQQNAHLSRCLLQVKMYLKPEDRQSIISDAESIREENQLVSEKNFKDGLWQEAPEALKQNKLRVILKAETVIPELIFDPNPFNRRHPEPAPLVLKTNPDQFEKFEKKSPVTYSLSLQNSLNIPVSFQLSFRNKNLFSVKHSSFHPLLKSRSPSTIVHLKTSEETSIELQLHTPNPSRTISWPVKEKFKIEDTLHIEYPNGSVFDIPIIAHLHRPILSLSFSSYDFGTIYLQHSTKTLLTIHNPTCCDGRWKISPVKSKIFSKKNSMHPSTLKNLNSKNWDPYYRACTETEVFSFETMEGVCLRNRLPRPEAPMGTIMLSHTTLDQSGLQTLAYNKERESLQIWVAFSPKEAKKYRCTFQFETLHGNTTEFTLQGCGSYSENTKR